MTDYEHLNRINKLEKVFEDGGNRLTKVEQDQRLHLKWLTQHRGRIEKLERRVTGVNYHTQQNYEEFLAEKGKTELQYGLINRNTGLFLTWLSLLTLALVVLTGFLLFKGAFA